MTRKVTIRFEDRDFWIERLTAMVAHEAARELALHNIYVASYEEEYNRRSWFFRLCNVAPQVVANKKVNNPFSPALALNRMLKVVSGPAWSTYTLDEHDFIWISTWEPTEISISEKNVYRYGRDLS